MYPQILWVFRLSNFLTATLLVLGNFYQYVSYHSSHFLPSCTISSKFASELQLIALFVDSGPLLWPIPCSQIGFCCSESFYCCCYIDVRWTDSHLYVSQIVLKRNLTDQNPCSITGMVSGWSKCLILIFRWPQKKHLGRMM